MKLCYFVLAVCIVAIAFDASAQQKGKPQGGPKQKWRVQQLRKDNNEGIAVGVLRRATLLPRGKQGVLLPRSLRREARSKLYSTLPCFVISAEGASMTACLSGWLGSALGSLPSQTRLYLLPLALDYCLLSVRAWTRSCCLSAAARR